MSMCKSFLGASLVPPRCLLGASSVPPWCLPGASLHPLTWSQGLFWTPKIAEDCHSELTGCQLGCIWCQLGPIPGQLKSTRGHFQQTYVPLGDDIAIVTPIATRGTSTIIVFPLVFQCFWHVGLQIISVPTCDNLNPTWTRFRMSWGQFGDNLN